jgi:hypothetical protein
LHMAKKLHLRKSKIAPPFEKGGVGVVPFYL